MRTRDFPVVLGLSFCALILSTVAPATGAGFVENRGQVDSQVLYYLPYQDAVIYFTENGLVVDLEFVVSQTTSNNDVPGPKSPVSPTQPGMDAEESRARFAVPVRFVGASTTLFLAARQQLSTEYNFFLGDDITLWQTRVPCYSELTYHEVWPGIDVVYSLNAGEISCRVEGDSKYEFELALLDSDGWQKTAALNPRSRPGLRLDKLLDILTPDLPGEPENLLKLKPVDNGDCAADAKSEFDLIWGTFVGGSSNEYGRSLARDGAGNILLCARTMSSDFPTTTGVIDTTHNGGWDCFVAKLDPTGSNLLYATFLGGSGEESFRQIAVDPAGNAYVGGYTYSSNFPTTPGAFDTSHNGDRDVVVCKLDPNGSTLEYATYIGADQEDYSYGLTVNATGNTFVTGYTRSAAFPISSGAFDEFHNGFGDAFVLKLGVYGNSLRYSTFLGGQVWDDGRSIVVDTAGDAYIVGMTQSSNFPTTPGAYDRTHNGYIEAEIWVARLESDGRSLVFSTYFGGSGWDEGQEIAIDHGGDIYICGTTESGAIPTTAGAYDRTHNGGGRDGIVAKFNGLGTTLIHSTYVGGNDDDQLLNICLNGSGGAFLSGRTESVNYPTSPDAYDLVHSGSFDGLLTVLDNTLSNLEYSTFLGGSGSDVVFGHTVDASNNTYLTGHTNSTGFPTTPGAYDRTHNGGNDCFVCKLFPSEVTTSITETTTTPMSARLTVHPNPFNPLTTIQYELAQRSKVSIEIFDLRGRRVAKVADQILDPGLHQVTWDGNSENGTACPSGTYLVIMQSDVGRQQQKTVLLR